MVTIQKGHLYRAEGYNITIWCNVSGYGGPLEQTFQWFVYWPSAPKTGMQLVSTSDSSFHYAVYAKRVKAGEIYIERIQGDSVLLHITNLRTEDAGEYECHTPTTDKRYLGTYSAKTSLSGKLKNILPIKIIDTGPVSPKDYCSECSPSYHELCRICLLLKFGAGSKTKESTEQHAELHGYVKLDRSLLVQVWTKYASACNELLFVSNSCCLCSLPSVKLLSSWGPGLSFWTL